MDQLHTIRERIAGSTGATSETELGEWVAEIERVISTSASGHSTNVATGIWHWLRGWRYYLRSEHDQCLRETTIALHHLADAPNAPERARCRLLAGNALYACGKLEEALREYSAARVEFQNFGWTNGLGRSIGNIGNIYLAQGNMELALQHYSEAFALHQHENDAEGMARTLGGMGLVHASRSEYASATELISRSIEYWRSLGNIREEARMLGGLANVYRQVGEYITALEYLGRVQAIVEELRDQAGLARVLLNIAAIYEEMADPAKSIEVARRAQEINSHTSDTITRVRIHASLAGSLTRLQQFSEALEYATMACSECARLGLRAIGASNTRLRASILSNLGRTEEAAPVAELALSEARSTGSRTEEVEALQLIGGIHSMSNRTAEALQTYNEALLIARELGERSREAETMRALSELYEHSHPAKALELYRASVNISNELLGERQRHHLSVLDTQRKLSEERNMHEQQRALLRQIMPDEVVTRIIRGEDVIADTYENVSVLFLDIVGFTAMASHVSAEGLIRILNDVFERCDAICDRYDLTKIKTIGDAYLAIAGMPVPHADHMVRLASAALDLSDSLSTMNMSLLFDHGTEMVGVGAGKLQTRLGLHCGSVVAGVIGKKRAQYDVWGDAVNVASRMESQCVPGRIHVSDDFAVALARDAQPSLDGADVIIRATPFQLRLRGTIEVKGKGQMRTWWLERG